MYFAGINSKNSYYDENWYIQISDVINSSGLFMSTDGLRTYMYPLFIAICRNVFGGDLETLKMGISIIQYCILYATVMFVAVNVYKKSKNQIAFFGVLTLGLINPYLVQATTLILSDILAACLITVACVCLAFYDWNKWNTCLVASAFLFSSVMVRPSNAIFIILFLIVIIVRWFVRKDFKMYRVILCALAMSVIVFPQLMGNVVKYDHFTPLLHKNLYEQQTEWAASYLRYGTVLMDDENAQLFYNSPFPKEKGTTMFKLLYKNPFQFIFIYTAHIFSAIDWGFVDTYTRTLDASDRVLQSALLCIEWFLMGVGLYVMWRNRKINYLTLGFLAIGYLLFIGTTCVESRFGYPVYLILLGVSGPGLSHIVQNYKDNAFIVRLTSIFIAYMNVFLFLTYKVDMMTGRIIW